MTYCSAHNIIEQILRFPVRNQEDANASDVNAGFIERSEKFTFDFLLSEAIKELASVAYNKGMLRFPYQFSYFEWSTPGERCRLAAAIYDHGDYVQMQGYLFSYDEGSSWFPSVNLRIQRDHGADKPKVTIYEPEWSTLSKIIDTIKPDHIALCNVYCKVAFGYAAAFDIKSKELIHHDVSGKLNKNRAAKGKPPLFKYRTMKIVLPLPRKDRIWQGGTHASPIFHTRRGHNRRLPDGRVITIPECDVGARENGVLLKEYRVALSKREAEIKELT